MKIDLAYPKIPDCTGFLPTKCIAYEKIDGSNINFSWNKSGWQSFGTRRDKHEYSKSGKDAFIETHPGLEEVYDLFDDLYAAPLNKFFVMTDGLYEHNITVFGEYYGEGSFAGEHNKDDNKSIVFFDIAIEGKIIDPYTFHKYICVPDIVNTPKVVYNGKFHGQFTEDVRKGKYNVKEGVVCKGLYNNEVHMCKIKTEAYMERLKNKFKDKWKEYWE